MEITVLVDNNTLIDRYFLADPGLSLLIEDDETTVLFDTGYSDIFLKNASKLGKGLTTLAYLEALQPAAVHACHCTDLPSKIALSRVTHLKDVGVGLKIKYF